MISDVYQLTHTMLWNNAEPMVNVYFYQRNTGLGTAQQLANAWSEDVLPAIRAWQSQIVWHDRCEVINLGDLTDFGGTNYTNTRGLNTSADPLPAFNAVQYTLRAGSRAVRPGSKRYPGITEGDVTAGVITSSGVITQLNALGAALIANIQAGTGETFAPVIVKRVKYAPEPGKVAYRLPETTGELVAPGITGYSLNFNISHQVSRGNAR